MFYYRGSLNHHNSTVHGNSFKCDTCEKNYSSKDDLRIHIDRVHLNKRIYNCDRCDKSFHSKAKLKRHIDSVHKKSIQKSQTILGR